MSSSIPHIGDHARQRPDKHAIIMSDGSPGLTYGELDRRSDALAGQLRAAGVAPGDGIALLMENRPEFLIAAWAAHRLGVYYTPVNWHLTVDEAAYIVSDCQAKALLTSPERADVVAEISARCPGLSVWMCDAQGPSGFAPQSSAAPAPAPYTPLDGSAMIYSSGTSGRPKGIKRALSGKTFGVLNAGDQMLRGLFGFTSASVLLNPSPLYHAGPLTFCMSTHRLGGTVVLMRNFEPEEALSVIERARVTAAWLVPTMMIRLLRLPEERKARADVSSLTHAIHTAAPCPQEIKRAMLAWWGPTIYEFYAATEGNGFTTITPQEWLAHPGSVGRSDTVRILGENGEVMPTGEVGVIYFANAWTVFEYHNDPAKTAEATDARGWTTIGDMGYLDAENYLYLTDRKSHMIISGGVNIYPQEIENVLVMHPAVADVAVIGVPHPEYGEEVKAVIELIDPAQAESKLAQDLIAYCQERLAKYKCPRSVDFIDHLPRLPTGKLLKRDLRARYWADAKAMI